MEFPKCTFGVGWLNIHVRAFDSAREAATEILSGTGAHGECATFEVWVEAFGAELLLLLNKKDGLGSLVIFYNSKYGHTNTIQSAIFEEKRSSNGST